jgi:hypothetical protein
MTAAEDSRMILCQACVTSGDKYKKVFPKCSLGIDKSQAFPAPKDKNDRQSDWSVQEAF